MRTSLRQTLLATGALLALGSFAAQAAPPPAAGLTSAPATTQAMPAAPAPATPATPKAMAERVNQRIARLHAELHITAAQAAPWNHFTAVMRADDRAMDQAMHRRLDRLPDMNAEQNMQSYAHIAALHAENMHKLLPAFERLYHTMSASQKQTVDQVFRNDADRGRAARHG